MGRAVTRRKKRTDADQLADLAVCLLEITAELLKLSRDDRTELLTVVKELRNVRARLMDRMRAAAS